MAEVPNQDPEVPLQDPQVQDQDRENPVPKKSKGRRKVNMAKMENKSNLQVTFSKRRSGLFKKASELVTLCGIDMALIVFSPGDKAFSFGHPSVDNIIDRFLTQTLPPPNPTDNIVVAQQNENVSLLNMQLTNAHAMLEAERRSHLEIDDARVVGQSQHRWEAPLEELSHDELLEFKSAMATLKVNVEKEVERLMQEQQQSLSSFGGGIGGALAFSSGPSFFEASSSVPPFSQFSAGSSSLRSGTGLPFSTWSVGGSSGISGALPPFPGDVSSCGPGGAGGSGNGVLFHPESSSFGCGSAPLGPSSFRRGGALQFSLGPSSFGRGDGSGDGGAMPPIGPSSSGRGRGRGQPPRSRSGGRGSNRGSGRGS
ncbi:hypothetical protein Vadar_003248 [Vaccinium darrowii]|uniref:Uncharacterized protein n=1 Tax=Vaccinium darrowii TaxID=229202 RepID=A0ACB7YB62_9ERIC|nr:hypothetical protein Vadar_003248 [Vaccinium darrowii]